MSEHIHDENCEHNHDGIDNDEHIIDMEKEGQMLYQNIKDNTDGAVELAKSYEEAGDQDIADAVKIEANEILEVEKGVVDIFDNFEKLFISLSSADSVDDKKIEIFENYFDALSLAEKKSTELFNNLLLKLK